MCGNLKNSTQKTQYKQDMIMDTWKIDKQYSSEKFLKLNHTVLLLGVREPAETVLSSAQGSSPFLKINFILGFLDLEMGPIACTQTSVRNYYYMFHNNPEEGR